jgi:hypothetical protein
VPSSKVAAEIFRDSPHSVFCFLVTPLTPATLKIFSFEGIVIGLFFVSEFSHSHILSDYLRPNTEARFVPR